VASLVASVDHGVSSQRGRALPYAIRLANPGKHLYPPPLTELTSAEFETFLCTRPSVDRSGQLYLHVPFCETICSFCPIHKSKVPSAGVVDEYVRALVDELAALSGTPAVRRIRFDNVYFGGGTASLLPNRAFAALMELIQDRFTLDAPQCTLEGHVHSLTEEKVRLARSLGVNRISLGVQTFEPRLRGLLNLTPSEGDIRRCLDAIRRAGIDDINLDLMCNLPGQSPEVWERDLRAAVALDPSGLDLYEAVVVDGTPLAKQVASGHVTIDSNPAPQVATYLVGEAILTDAGFEQRNLFVWNRPGIENRLVGTQGALRDGTVDVVGAGLSAYSVIDGHPFLAEPNRQRYVRRVRSGRFAARWHHECTKRERMERFMIMSLEEFTFSPAAFACAFGRGMEDIFHDQLRSFHRRGLIERRGADYVLTRLGRAWATTMAVEFFGASVLEEMLRERVRGAVQVGLTREEAIDLPIFALFHPAELLGSAHRFGVLVDYVRFLWRTDRTWPVTVLRELRRAVARAGLPALRWYANTIARHVLAWLAWRTRSPRADAGEEVV